MTLKEEKKEKRSGHEQPPDTPLPHRRWTQLYMSRFAIYIYIYIYFPFEIS
jgi:hypothetical protein